MSVGGHPHFTVLGRIVDDLLYEFEKLRGADDGVGTLRGFDQILLREFCAEESAFEQTFGSYDGQSNMMCDPGCRSIGEKVGLRLEVCSHL